MWKLANNLLFVPDPDIGWLPFGVRMGVPVIRRCDIDVVLSSAPPFTAHLVGLGLKLRTGIPWVADFRDAWSQNPYLTAGHFRAIRRPLDKALERKVMKAADAIISVSQPMADAFRLLKLKGITPKLHMVSNGYDPEDFRTLNHQPPPRFTVTYTGTFYGRARSPVPFMRALAELIEEGAIRREKVCVKIVERYPQDSLRLVARYKLSDVFQVRVGLPHVDAIQEQANASVLLLVIRGDPGGIGIYTAKLFEYLGARRPILALAPKEGVAASLVREANAGIVVDPANRSEIKEAILRYYSEHERTGSVRYYGRDEIIRRYERPVLAGRLANILDSLASPQSPKQDEESRDLGGGGSIT